MLEKLRYGTSSITLDLNNKFCFYPLSSPAIEQKYEEADIVRLALKETDIPLSRYIKHGDKIALVISDQTRPTGSNIYVPILLEEIMKFGVSKVTVIIALGLHQSPTFKEIRILFGGEVPANLIVVKHDAWKDLKQQGEARFRREAVDADKIILTGAVTFHPMTGYSGGRKSLLPGVAAVDDIYSNHRLYFEGYTKHPGVGPAIIRDNPVCKDIRERTSGFKNLWALNVVLGEDKKIAYASCGNVDKVWTLCCNQVSQRSTVKIDALYDAVIASAGGYPSDFSFYQSMKVLTNSSRACKNNGILIVLSQCPNGWEIRKDLFRYFSMTQEQIAEDLLKEFTIDGLALYMALNIIRKHKVWLYSDLPKNEVELAGMHYITDKRMITDIIPESENVALITNGASILPVHVDIEGEHHENEYKRAFSLLGMKIGLISNSKSILFDDEYFLGKGSHLHSLLSNFHILNPIPNESDAAMDMIFKVVDKSDTETKFESHESVYKVSGPIKELDDSAGDKRASIFGNMGIFSKVAIRELEKLGIFSFHSTSFVHPATNTLYLVLGKSGVGKSTVLLKAIIENLQVFGTELTHIQIVDGRVRFIKGSLWQNCRIGNLVEDFPSLLEKFNINYRPNGNPWQQYISIDMNPWQYPKDIMIDPKVIILYPRIESERNLPERYKLDIAGTAYTLFENLSNKVSPPSLLYKKLFIPSVDNREGQVNRMAAAEEFIRYANIIASWKVLTSPNACLDTLLPKV